MRSALLAAIAICCAGCGENSASPSDSGPSAGDGARNDLAACHGYWCDPNCPAAGNDGCPRVGGPCSVVKNYFCGDYPGFCEFSIACINGVWSINCDPLNGGGGPECPIPDMSTLPDLALSDQFSDGGG